MVLINVIISLNIFTFDYFNFIDIKYISTVFDVNNICILKII